MKYKTFGCGAAIAVSSMVSEMVKGKTLKESLEVMPALVAKELEGLPKNKMHCSNLGAQALRRAIRDYAIKNKIEMPGLTDVEDKEEEDDHACQT